MPRTSSTACDTNEGAKNERYARWKQEAPHLEEYASEALGTAFLVFCVVGTVGLMFGTGSPAPGMIPSHLIRLAITGLVLGCSSALVAISPPGRLSGAHLNPAMTAGFWILRKVHTRDLLGYVVGQAIGAIAGAALGSHVFAHWITGTHHAALIPRPNLLAWECLVAEFGTTFALAAVVFTCVSHTQWMRWTPWIASVCVSLLVAADGSISGCGMNPARWLGPAWASGIWQDGWIYCVGPVLGAAAAALMRRHGSPTHPVPRTAKMYHDHSYRSIFKHDSVPTQVPKQVRNQG